MRIIRGSGRGLVSRAVVTTLIASLLASVALIAGPIAPTQAAAKGRWGGYFSDDKKVYSGHPAWMTDLPDTLMIGDMSIPMSHDSGAQLENFTSQTQSLTIAQQLEAGIRGFDIRYVCKGVGTLGNTTIEDQLQVYHGIIDQHLLVSEILDAFVNFLAANPGEFLLVNVKNEGQRSSAANANYDTCEDRDGKPATSEVRDNLLNNGRYSGLWYTDTDADGLEDRKEINVYGTGVNDGDTDDDKLNDADEIYYFDSDPKNPISLPGTISANTVHDGSVSVDGPNGVGDDGVANQSEDTNGRGSPPKDHNMDQTPRLGELRGKAIRWRDFDNQFSEISIPKDDQYEVCFTPVAGCAYTVEEKISEVNVMMDRAHDNSNRMRLYYSDAVGSTFALQKDVAAGTTEDRGINEGILEYMHARPWYTKVGLINLDFPGPGLIDHIINFNQQYGLDKTDPPGGGAPKTPAYEVGVLNAEGCPKQAENMWLRMDTEDDNNDNSSGGWNGASYQDDHAVVLGFCRANGLDFHPPKTGMYGVLKLGSDCPPGSNEIWRKMDDEDTDNNNQRSGDMLPNGGTTSSSATRIYLCTFNAADRQSGQTGEFPELGFPYGVFGNPNYGLTPYQDQGWIKADNEDDDNVYEGSVASDSPAWQGMITRHFNAQFYMVKAQGWGVSLSVTPGVDFDGFYDFERGISAPLTVTATAYDGNPAVLNNNPPGVNQSVTLRASGTGFTFETTAPLNNLGKATFELSNMPVGAHTIDITYADTRGHFESAYKTTKVRVTQDTTAPVTSFATPQFGESLNRDVWLSGCSSLEPGGTDSGGICGTIESDDTITDWRVDVKNAAGLYWNGSTFSSTFTPTRSLLGLQSAGNSNQFAFRLPLPETIPSGNYTTEVRVRDTTNQAPTAIAPWTYDANRPAFTHTFPANGATVSRFNFGSTCSPLGEHGICGFVTELEGPIHDVTLSLRRNGGAFQNYPVEIAPVPGDPTKWAWWSEIDEDVNPLAGGTYDGTVQAFDRSGNEGQSQFGFAVNAEPPEISISAPKHPTSTNPVTPAMLDSVDDWPLPCGSSTGTRTIGRFCGRVTDDLPGVTAKASLRDEAGHYFDFTTFKWSTEVKAPVAANYINLNLSDTGTFHYVHPGTLADGKYVFHVIATDANGGGADLPRFVTWDRTAPVPEITALGDGSKPGWFNSDVQFFVSDPNAVTPTTCSVTPKTASAPVVNAVATATCTDGFGRTGQSTFTYSIDETAPTATITPNPAPNANGWYKAMPSLANFVYGGTDNADPDPTCQLVSETPITNGKRLTVQCADAAGNVDDATFDIRVDSVKPSLSAFLTHPTPESGWFTYPPTATLSGVDTGGSGIDFCDPNRQYDGPDGTNLTMTMTCTDKAGNVGTDDTFPFKVDRGDPAVTVAPLTTPDGTNSWYKTNPTVRTTGTDLSGIAEGSCTPDAVWAGGDTSMAVATGSCSDILGHVGNGTSLPFQVDTVAPTATVKIKTAPNGTNGWYKTKPMIVTTGTDATSGIGSCTPETRYRGVDGTVVFGTGSCTDKAGHTTTANSPTFKVDSTKPVVKCPANAPVFVLNQTGASLTPTVTDKLSGAKPAVAKSVRPARVGSFTASLSGTDLAGNTASVACPYTVTYAFSVTPLAGVAPGSTVTFTLQLLDANGVNVSKSDVAVNAVSGLNAKEKFVFVTDHYELRHRTSPGPHDVTFKATKDPVAHTFTYTTAT